MDPFDPGAGMNADPERAQIFHSDPGILVGTPVFAGTIVPVERLVEWLEGDTRWTSSSSGSRRWNGGRRSRSSATPCSVPSPALTFAHPLNKISAPMLAGARRRAPTGRRRLAPDLLTG
jgi:hypothetical protein